MCIGRYRELKQPARNLVEAGRLSNVGFAPTPVVHSEKRPALKPTPIALCGEIVNLS
jgi:hypothetical protein